MRRRLSSVVATEPTRIAGKNDYKWAGVRLVKIFWNSNSGVMKCNVDQTFN